MKWKGKSNLDEKCSQGGTSKDKGSTSDAGMETLDGNHGSIDDDDKTSIVLASRAIHSQEEEKQDVVVGNEREGTGSNECVIESNVKNKDKDLENKTKLFVHSSLLAVHSSYFRSLFYSGMKETHSKEVVMRIHQSELPAHLILIEAIYRLEVLDDKECSLVVEVLALADKYDVNLVFKKCKYVLLSSSISLEDCEYIVKITSGIPDCGDILDAMEKFLVTEFSPLDKTWQSEKFHELSKVSLKLLLGSDRLVVDSENTVFIALMEWIDRHLDEIRDGRSLLSLVRFELMTVGFMYDIVRHHELAKRLSGFNEFLHHGLSYHAFSPSRLEEVEVKPVNRCAYSNNDSTFTWIIDQDEQRKLIEYDVIFSSFFWCKGYMLKLKLRYEEITQSYSLFLYVQNLENKGHVKISWRARSELFANTYMYCTITSYTRPSKGFGHNGVLSNIAPSMEPNTLSHTIDVWVDIK